MNTNMKVARIAYLNTDPFFYNWPMDEFQLSSGFPRQLAQAAHDADVIAGPMPIVECWKLEDKFDSLKSWGIAVENKCQSVLLFSSKPFNKLNNANVGLTRESSTSVALLDVIMKKRYGFEIQLTRGLRPDQDAWLVIGDQALQMWASPQRRWAYATDLATEWWDWHQLPFVFARWVVKKGIEGRTWVRLFNAVENSLSMGINSLDQISKRRSKDLNLSYQVIKNYLVQFNYELGPREMASIDLFRHLVSEARPELVRA